MNSRQPSADASELGRIRSAWLSARMYSACSAGKFRRDELRVLHGDGVVKNHCQPPAARMDVIHQLPRAHVAVKQLGQQHPTSPGRAPVPRMPVQRHEFTASPRQQPRGPGGRLGEQPTHGPAGRIAQRFRAQAQRPIPPQRPQVTRVRVPHHRTHRRARRPERRRERAHHGLDARAARVARRVADDHENRRVHRRGGANNTASRS